MQTQEIEAPANCPDCAEPIQEFTEPRSGIVSHWCVNEHCAGRIKDMLTFVADRRVLEIEGLGPEMAEKLAGGGFVQNLADLFLFTSEAREAQSRMGTDRFERQVASQGLPAAAVLRMIQTTERAAEASWERWIAALGIPSIGITLGKLLAEKLALGKEDMNHFPALLLRLEGEAIEGIGAHKKATILAFARSPSGKELCERLAFYGVRPKPLAVVRTEGAPLAQMFFVMTGEFPEIGSREYITAKLCELGATAKSGVTKKVSHLLVGEDPGQSKLSKARELAIKHLDGNWLHNTFDTYGFNKVGARFVIEDAE